MLNALGVLISNPEEISERAAVTLQANYLYGVESYAFSYLEVRTYLEKGYINAFRWESGEFIKVRIDFPKYIDIPFGVKYIKQNYAEEYDWIKKHTILLDEQAIDKYSLQREMLTSELSPYAIPTFPLTAYDDLVKMLGVFPQAIIKPMGGTKAAGLMKLDKQDETICYSTRDCTGEFSRTVFEEHRKMIGEQVVFLFEPRLNILNDAGRAVDFRCLVALNGNAEWQNVLTYARIGGSNVASNFSDGGSLNFAIEVLEQMVPGMATEKPDEINAVALKVAKFIQSRSSLLSCRLGIDICLDRNTNRVYVIEANAKPGTKFVGPWPLQLVMAQYYQYVLKNGITDKNKTE